ncbi:hypothetical protein [Paenibacillus sp. IHBB 10380]|uniref:hypothetical protein n=1 Tax=Paenibacillus sp. IHBB 10380 TaxID=1566358 RepID=UPI000B0C3084|nr:hypothetical protein [Paenibacillus sp. IHBB 10380]
MYEYKYVETSLGGFFSSATHRDTIDEHARRLEISAGFADSLLSSDTKVPT